MTSTAMASNVRQLIGPRPAIDKDNITRPTVINFSQLCKKGDKRLGQRKEFRSLRNAIREGRKDAALAQVVYFGYEAYREATRRREKTKRSNAAEDKNALLGEVEAINLAKNNPAWAHEVIDLWERINGLYP